LRIAQHHQSRGSSLKLLPRITRKAKMSRTFWQVWIPVITTLLLTGCERSVVTEVRGHRIPAAQLRELRLQSTTPTEIETRFGQPDDRANDGALTYRYATVTRVRPRVAGLALPIRGREQVIEHTVTFRFENGVLSRICQTRSLPDQSPPPPQGPSAGDKVQGGGTDPS
jgi:hypothetical protein